MSRVSARTVLVWLATLVGGVEAGGTPPVDTHWAFLPVRRPPVPAVRDAAWPRNDIDRFVLVRLEAEGLRPAPEADRRDWLRRASLDLTGLPPTPEEIEAFLTDADPGGHERVIDRLLASPRHGERYARHWLDVARYADTHGYEVNTERPNAWPYRDYVIAAFNDDLPYDRFVTEQIAGAEPGREASTGFLVTAAVLLPGQIGADDVSQRAARQDALHDIVMNTSDVILGLTIGCARCHDHMFDPVTARDYYGLQAFFAGVEYGERTLPAAASSGCRPEPDPAPERRVFAGSFGQPHAVHLLHRGDAEQQRELVVPRTPAVFDGVVQPVVLSADATDEDRRGAVAAWLADAANPLPARVMVNRVWQWHFGTGLVDSPNDFGHNGSLPTHPELLDWLADELVAHGWSLKHLHRLIMGSATYRQSSAGHPAGLARDGESRLLWRFPPRRLEAEVIRDAMLAVAGRLNPETGGPGFDLFRERGGLSGFTPIERFDAAGRRRMVYAHKIRMEKEDVFGAFDCPDAGQSMARRRQSTTPLQALNLFNSPFTIDESQAFADRVVADVAAGDAGATDPAAARIERAFRLALGRPPAADEADDAEVVVRVHGLATLCRVLFNTNEFLFVP